MTEPRPAEFYRSASILSNRAGTTMVLSAIGFQTVGLVAGFALQVTTLHVNPSVLGIAGAISDQALVIAGAGLAVGALCTLWNQRLIGRFQPYIQTALEQTPLSMTQRWRKQALKDGMGQLAFGFLLPPWAHIMAMNEGVSGFVGSVPVSLLSLTIAGYSAHGMVSKMRKAAKMDGYKSKPWAGMGQYLPPPP